MTDKVEGTPSPEPRICPTCGTKVADDADRCVVCGSDLGSAQSGQLRGPGGKRTVSLPLALILLAVFSVLSVGLTYGAMRFTNLGEEPTPTTTPSQTPTQTNTPTPTATDTPQPTFTPLPPIEYQVVENDTCAGLAYFFNVSVRSIIELNNLGVDCPLSVGQTVQIPQPTPTATAPPTATLAPNEATEAACEKINYTVEANDTLSGIAENYQVAMQAIKEYNALPSDTVLEGQVLIIPLCERLSYGPTPTPTPPPPWPAPNLLLPKDGESFTLANDTVTLQWAAVGELREDEYYQVSILDVTEGSGTQIIVDYVSDTKYIVPDSFRPSEAKPHVMRWWIQPVRRARTTPGGEARYESAGAESIRRVFTWSGAAPDATPVP